MTIWGKWFQAKINAVEVARKQAHKVAGQALYMSSVTDPYLPAERGLQLTRGSPQLARRAERRNRPR